jgi:galactose oxidase
VLNLTTYQWAPVGKMNFGDRYYTTQVLLPNSYKVFIAGGTPSNAGGGGTTPTATTEIIDLSAKTPVWAYGTSMNIARYNHTLVYLADGTLLAVGGNAGPGHYANPVFAAELYNPTTEQWSLMASQIGVRAYHSVAILLADGRVVSTGSTSGTTYNHYLEIFSPPYLYNGSRPTITASPASVSYGQQFTITTPDASNISSVALVMPCATTHANDMQQRYVPLTFSTGNGALTAKAPPSGNWAPPGYYMLVIVNNSGVPSVMPFIQLSPAT